MLVTLRKIAAVGAIAFLTVLGGTATASAQPSAPHASQTVTAIQSLATGRCIDDSDFAFRTNTCNNSIYQDWSAIPYNDGTFQFQDLATGRCIDDSDFAFRTNTCNTSVYQGWSAYRSGNGWALQNLSTHRCIDDSDFGFRTNACNGSVYQTFSLSL